MSVPGIGRTLSETNHIAERNQDSSPEKEREERDFAIKIIKRLEQTNDFAPLVREFYIKTFVFHLKAFLMDPRVEGEELTKLGIERRVLASATLYDYRRAYVAMMNAWNQFNRFNDAVDGYVATMNSVEGGDIFDSRYKNLRAVTRVEALTPAFFFIANSNPLLSILVSTAVLETRYDDEGAYNEKLRLATIQTVKDLRLFITAVTKCVNLMDNAVRKLRLDQDKLRVGRQVEYKSAVDSIEVYKYRTETLAKEAYGLRKGTNLIYARVYPYEIVMTRRNGRLRVVALYPDFDGD